MISSKLKPITISVYRFDCPECGNTFTYDKPFEIHFCPYCAFNIYKEVQKNDTEVAKRNILDNMKSKYPLTDKEKDAIDYAIFLIQNEIDGEVD